MNPVPVLVLIAIAVGVQAHDLSPRTFGFLPSGLTGQQGHHNSHTHQHGSHATQAQGHPNHVLPAHQPHVGHAHQVPVNVHTSHAVHEHHGGHGHVHNHQPASTSHATAVNVPSNANSVPVLVCRVVHVPVTPAGPAASSSAAGSVVPPAVLGNITTKLETVVGSVVDPVVALLHNASVWLNRTAHRHNVHGGHVHQHHQHSSVSAVDAVHQKVLALKMHNNHVHPGSGRTPVAHTATPGSPDRSVATTAAATQTPGPGHAATTAALTPSRVPAQVLTSTVGAPAPRLLTEPSLTSTPTPETTNAWTAVTLGTSVQSTDGAMHTDVPPSVTLSVLDPISVKSGHVFTTEAQTTVSSAPNSTLPDALFELTPRAQNAASADDLCRLLAARCERRFRRRLCRLFEECLENGTRRRECLQALTSVISSDERCTRA